MFTFFAFMAYTVGAMLCKRALSLVLLLALPALSAAQKFVFDLVKLEQARLIRRYGAEANLVGRALEMRFLPNEDPNFFYPTVFFDLPSTTGANRDRGQNWSQATAFMFELENLSAEPVEFRLRVDSKYYPNFSGVGMADFQTAFEYIDAGQKRRFAFHCNFDPTIYGMRGLPNVGGADWLRFNRNENANLRRNNVVRWAIFVERPRETVRLNISEPMLVTTNIDLSQISDRFGQYSRDTWPGKVFQEAELPSRKSQEELEIAQNPAPWDRDELGAWLLGPQLPMAARWSLQQIKGKWWFISPQGRPYFAMGMDTVALGDATITQAREYMFLGLPTGGALAQFFGNYNGQTTFSHYQANLLRKHGGDILGAFDRSACDRLRSWGFNLLGNWTEYRVWEQRAMPYVVGLVVGPKAGGTVCPSFTVDVSRKKLYDAFDPRFEQMLAEQAALIPTVPGDPLCLGWYVDNEPSFLAAASGVLPETEEQGRYGIAYSMLKRPASQWAGKAQFVSDLRAKHGTITNLNLAWGLTGTLAFATWEQLEGTVNLPLVNNANRRTDFLNFTNKYLDVYFRKSRDAVRARDGRALYLGCRFYRHSEEVRRNAARYADVLNFNYYGTGVDSTWNTRFGDLGRPLMISEFHFGATDRGMFHAGLAARPDQESRAAAFTSYVMSVATNPLFVGVNYHQLLDSPLTGRQYDGENYGIGWITATDTPYAEMIAAARDTLYNVYDIRGQ